MPSVGQYCTRNVVTVNPRDGLLDAARVMRDRHVGCVVVVGDEQGNGRVPVGILTDRDIVVGLLAQTDRHLHLVRVDDIMTKSPITANETEDLSDTLLRMRSAGIRRVPVVNQESELSGLLSFDDLVDYVQDELSDLARLLKNQRVVEEQVRR
jgi:CBS domain-containing protein